MEEENYEEDQLDLLFGKSPARELKLSYSRISNFYKFGPSSLLERVKIKGEGVMIGSLTDDLLYSKMVDKNHFKKKYYICDGNKPTATLGKLIDIIIENKNKKPSKEEVLDIVKKNSYLSSTKKEELLIENFDKKEFWEYLDSHYKSKGRLLIGSLDYSLAEELVSILRTHENSKHIFDIKPNLSTIYQFPVKFEFKGFLLRGLIDFVIIDHDKKTIKFIDLKTGKDSYDFFVSSLLKFRYDLQEAVYTLAFEEVKKSLDLKDYTLENFEFLYISRSEKIPVIYKVTEKWHVAAKNGYSINGRHIKGLYELIDDIKWHWDNKIFDIPKEIYISKGKIELEDNFIEIKNN